MQIKLTAKFWLDLGLAALLPLLAWYVCDDLKHGRLVVAAITCTLLLFNLSGSCRLFDFLLTGFCMWWIKRKAIGAMRFIDNIKAEVSKDDAP